MSQFTDAAALASTSGLEAAVEALAVAAGHDITNVGRPLSNRLAELGHKVGLDIGADNFGQLVRRSDGVTPLSADEAFQELVAALEAKSVPAAASADKAADVHEGGPSAHSEPEVPAVGSSSTTATSGLSSAGL